MAFRMTSLVTALAAGFLFGLGLAVSRMVNPAKVLAFLDVAGDWDPSLALVMAGALAVNSVAFGLTVRRERPVFAEKFLLPDHRRVDARLAGGSLLFGVGWGLVGFCPGPAVSSLAYGAIESVYFLLAMVAGMTLARVLH